MDDRNRKDYATDKWEQELRAELEAKRIAQNQRKTVKLTREQQVLVNEQLGKEAAIRKRVEALHRDQCNGVAMIEAIVANGNEECLNDIYRWLCHVVDVIRFADDVGGRPAQELGWMVAEQCYHLVERVTAVTDERVRAMTEALLFAYLRHLEVDTIPYRWLDEDLTVQTRRIVDQIRRDIQDNGALPAITFAVCFPLFNFVIREGVKGHAKLKHLVDAAVDVLTAHSSLGTEGAMPRKAVIDLLLAVIAAFPKHAKAAQVFGPRCGCALLFTPIASFIFSYRPLSSSSAETWEMPQQRMRLCRFWTDC